MIARKLALKKLTASDLTFFEWHFKNQPAGNQKAINLNADIFVDRLYPGLPPLALQQIGGRIPLDLHIYGPGMAGEYNLQRKIIKAAGYKNWRLDGEFIFNPADDQVRFNVLAPDDLAIIEFAGEPVPISATLIFVARNVADDFGLFKELSSLIGARSMIELSPSWLDGMPSRIDIPDGHPVNVVLLEASLEDAAQGGIRGVDQLAKRPSLGQVSREALERARLAARAAGDLGEDYVNSYLLDLKDKGEIADFEWTSSANAVAPFDFRVRENGGAGLMIDVKATNGPFESPLHISLNELRAMNTLGERYDLFRVFEMTPEGARLRICRDMRLYATTLLGVLNGLPPGTTVDSVSLLPSVLSFEKAIDVQLPAALA